MNFLETARDLETQIQHYYQELADKCADNEGLRYILSELIMDHKQHGSKLQLMTDDKCPELKTSESFHAALNFFRNLQKEQETFSCDIDQANMYRQAVELIERKIEFYEKAISDLNCADEQAVITEILKDEKRHKFVLENIIEIVTKPHSWLENAEFNHLDEF